MTDKINTKGPNISKKSDKNTEDYISIGDMKYDQKLSRIEKNQQFFNISGQSKKIFDYLIEHNQRSVTRQELSVLLWNSEDVPESRLYQAIRELRKTLGDTQPWQIIDTPSKNLVVLKPTVKFHKIEEWQDKKQWSFYKTALAASLLVSISVLATNFTNSNSGTIYTVKQSEHLTNIKGKKEFAAMSPNGEVLLFTHQTSLEQPRQLTAKRVNPNYKAGEVKTLLIGNKNEYNTEPSFSPSGKRIAWIKTDYRKYCDVMIADFIADSLSINQARSVLDCSTKNFARTPKWKSETSLLVSMPQGRDRPNAIEEFNLLTNERKIITSPIQSQTQQGDYSLFYNRDADKVAYLRQTIKKKAATELRIYDFKRQKDYLLKSYPHALYSVAWVDSERILARGNKGYEVIDLKRRILPLSITINVPLHFPFFIDKNTVGFVVGQLSDTDIVKHDLLRRSTDNSLSSPSIDYRVVVAKSSNDVAFVSRRDDEVQLFLSQNGHTKPLKKFKKRDQIVDIAISPDGKFIAYMLNSQLNVIDQTGKLYFQKNLVTSGLSFSFDSSQLVAGIRKDNKVELVSFSIFEDFKPTKIVSGFMPKVMPNGEIYFFEHLGEAKQPTLSKISQRGDVTRFFDVSFALFRSTSFDVIDDHLYYVEHMNGSKQLVRKNLENYEVSALYPVSRSDFSLNMSATEMYSTERIQVQNDFVQLKISR